MKRRNEKKHVIDFLFPLAVFFVLAASSVAIVVLASGFYSRQVKASSDSYSGRTALAYVTEKIHQNDENGAIADGTFDGENVLVIRQRYDEKDYVTYLYAYDGYLRELLSRMERKQRHPMDGKSWKQRTSGLRKFQMGFFICIVKMKTGKRQIHLSV